jgi:SAM-dependent methyltransferase
MVAVRQIGEILADTEFYDTYVKQSQGDLQQHRIRKIISLLDDGVGAILDIGCGPGTLLSIIRTSAPQAKLVGIDVATTTRETLASIGLEGRSVDAAAGLPFDDQSFDCVVCGEVIEHVADVDRLVSEIHRVLKRGGHLILTTPNLAYIPNRVLLAMGIQPLFTETSLHQNMGRRFKFLGQGGATQGHLKVFTLPALLELLASVGFDTRMVLGFPFFQRGIFGIIDRLLAIKPSFAAGFIVKARK